MHQVRRATKQDAAAIRLLEKELIVQEKKLTNAVKDGDSVAYYDIEALISDAENTLVLVKEVDGEIVGCGFGQVRENEPYYAEHHFGYIGLMSITPLHQGKGYGREIIKEILTWFSKKEIKEVKLKVFTDNINAIKAYRKEGFLDFSLDMRLELKH